MILLLLAYLAIGATASFVVGLLGLGAGMVILPALSFIFVRIFPHAVALKIAVGSSLFSFIPISISSALRYNKKQKMDLKLLYWIIPGYITGGILAPIIAHHTPAALFHIAIGSLLMCLAIFIFIRSWIAHKNQNQNPTLTQTTSTTTNPESKPINRSTLWPICALISTICGTAGIASGTLLIPYLSRKLAHLKAVTLSINAAIFYSLVTAISYIITGWHSVPGSPSLTQWGYVYAPAAILISIPAFFMAPLGVECAYRLPVNRLKLIFACLVFAAGVDLLF